eukprot:TRINITY_DN7137_c0_g1_i7.p1 TRINITY_DN7137_c0_g1~~TRINITY_DN7137_c0_g1_i7.p1  ORF type:complete len:115 (-),score=3.12 TRINITY_DN7137_c0_g1_i7:58-402(-)
MCIRDRYMGSIILSNHIPKILLEIFVRRYRLTTRNPLKTHPIFENILNNHVLTMKLQPRGKISSLEAITAIFISLSTLSVDARHFWIKRMLKEHRVCTELNILTELNCHPMRYV